MPFTDRTKGNFFTIFNGKFTRRVPEGTAGATTRINKEDRIVHEIYHDSFEGILIDIKTRESDKYGKSWEFIFKDEKSEDQYILQLPYSNSFATAILKMLPNIDVSKVMKLTPSVKLVDGKNQSTMFINQGGAPIKHAYTKDNQNGLPQMVKVVVKGQEVWDDTDRLVFLQNMVDTTILPKLPRTTTSVVADDKQVTLDDIKSNVDEDDANDF